MTDRRTPMLVIVASLFLAAPALSQAPAPQRPPKVLRYLTAEDINPSRLLPPPPPEGSEAARADIADVHRVIAARTPGRLAQAEWDDAHEDPSLYAPLLGPNFDMDALPATAEVLAIVKMDGDMAADAAKAKFARKRPWAADATIPTCDPNDKPLGSYPSGHATLGYSVGMTLAVLIPEKAQDVMARAADYAFSREVCGSHFASDTQASEALAAAVVTALLKNPEFRTKLAAAHAELVTAKLAAR